jgi:hypothetical protein
MDLDETLSVVVLKFLEEGIDLASGGVDGARK